MGACRLNQYRHGSHGQQKSLMSYLSLARRYRPGDFQSILAQRHITGTLSNAIASNRIAHAYLFCGPRGTGKTSTARVLAKSLNCHKGPTPTPCGECPNCLEIKLGVSPDVLEIDAASNRGIDDVRELRENVRYSPAASRYKIYIIDEVHRLTGEAFDALLKTLEEPPPHVIFIFATTEPQALPATILSRTQRFDFRRIPVSALAESISAVAKSEGVEIEPKAAMIAARKADGSLRDALSFLDQLINIGSGTITAELITDAMGLIKSDLLIDLFEKIFNHDTAQVMAVFDRYYREGSDIDELAEELTDFCAKLLMIKNGVKDAAALDLDSVELDKISSMIARLDSADLLGLAQIMSDYHADRKSGLDPLIAMEIALVRMANLDRAVDITELLGRFDNSRSGGQPEPNLPKNVSLNSAGKVSPDHPRISPAPEKSSRPIEIENDRKNEEYPPNRQKRALGDLAAWWPEFLLYLKSKSRAIWSNIIEATPAISGESSLRLTFSNNHEFNLKFMNREKRNSLHEWLKEFCGADYSVDYVKAAASISPENNGVENGDPRSESVPLPSARAETKAGGSSPRWRGSKEQFAREFLERNPLLKMLHDLIEGEDIGFKGNLA